MVWSVFDNVLDRFKTRLTTNQCAIRLSGEVTLLQVRIRCAELGWVGNHKIPLGDTQLLKPVTFKPLHLHSQ